MAQPRKVKGNSKTYLKVGEKGLYESWRGELPKMLTNPDLPESPTNPPIKDFAPEGWGWDVHEKDDGTTKKYLRKYYGPTDLGHIHPSISSYEYDGKTIPQLTIEIGNDVIQINKMAGKRLNGYYEVIARTLTNADPALEYSLHFSSRASTYTNGKGEVVPTSNKSVYFNYGEPNEKGHYPNFVKYAHMFGKDGDIPSGEPDEDDEGQPTMCYKKQRRYLNTCLKNAIAKFDGTAPVVEKPKPKEKTDDLPF